MADARRSLPIIAGMALLGGIFAQVAASAGEASNVDPCLAIADGVSLGAPLPHTRAKLQQG